MSDGDNRSFFQGRSGRTNHTHRERFEACGVGPWLFLYFEVPRTLIVVTWQLLCNSRGIRADCCGLPRRECRS